MYLFITVAFRSGSPPEIERTTSGTEPENDLETNQKMASEG